MRQEGIYNEEQHVDDELEQKVQNRYTDWKTYLRTIDHYLSSKKY